MHNHSLLFDPPPPRTKGGRMPTALSVNELQTASRAGLSADLRAFAALGVFPLTALTSVRASSLASLASTSAPIPEPALRAQLAAVLSSRPDAVKLGFLAAEHTLFAVAESFSKNPPGGPPVIIDPELIDPRGEPFLTTSVLRLLAPMLFPLADLVVLNAREAELFTGRRVYDRGTMREANRRLKGDLGLERVLICGGRIQEHAVDLFFDDQGCIEFGHDRVHTQGLRGMGSTFSALITAHAAHGKDWLSAIEAAKQAVSAAILAAPHVAPDQRQVDPMLPALTALRIDPTPLALAVSDEVEKV